MSSTLLRTLFSIGLAALSWAAFGQTTQNADCNSCPHCAVITDPSPANNPPGSTTTAGYVDASAACPATYTGTIAANITHRRFRVTNGNRYRVSLCALGIAYNTAISIRSDLPPYPVIPTFCDNDGCGLPNGPSSVIFDAPNPGPGVTIYRISVYNGTLCTLYPTHPIWTNALQIECLGPIPAPANDEPCNAVAIPLTNTNCLTQIPGTTTGATATTSNSLGIGTPLDPNQACGVMSYSGNDVWYSVTVPATGLIGINITESGVCATGIAVYTAPLCTTDPFNWITGTAAGVCSIDGLYGPNTEPGIVFDPDTYGLTPGQTVYIRVWERNNNENGNFTICAYNAQAPANDEPCGAILLTALDPCTPAEYSTENAQPLPAGLTVGNPGCGNPQFPGVLTAPDVWFRVVVPGTGAMTVTTSAGTLTDMAMAWYRPTVGAVLCNPPGYSGSLTLIGCSDNQSAANLMPRINSSSPTAIALTPGETIYIRVWNRPAGQFRYYGTFNICVTPNNPPPNDDPCGAIALDVNGDCVLIPATNENATNTPNAPTTFLPGASTAGAPTCGAANSDVWFTVDVPADLISPYGITFDTYGLTPLDFALAVYRDTSGLGCPTQLELAQVGGVGGCSLGGSTLGNASMPVLTITVPTITPGERLYVRVWRTGASQGIFSICARRNDPLLCQGTVYDSGGPANPYGDNENDNDVYCASKPGDVVTLTFSQFSLEPGFDFMRIYNQASGAPLPANLIGTYTGTNGPGTISGTITAGNPTGCLMVVFTSDFIFTAPGFAFKVSCGPPGPTPPPPVGDCGLTIFDPGGSTGFTYPGNLGVASTGIAPYHEILCPNNPGDVVSVNFSSFNVETFFDGLYIFNDSLAVGTPLNTGPVIATQINSGNGAQGTWSGPYNPPIPPNGAYWGNGSPGIVTSSITAANPGGCLTLVFYTDGIVSGSGWQGLVTCGPPPPVLPVIGQCNLDFYETPGGSSGNYADNVVSTQTFCPAVGQILQVNFSQFALEITWDKVYVFDGSSTTAPMIPSGNGPGNGPAPFGAGAYWGFTAPGPFTASIARPAVAPPLNQPSGCLTFHFVSDASVTFQGFRARTTCLPQASNDNPWNQNGTCTPIGATLLTPQTSCSPLTYSNTNTTATSGAPAPGCGNYNGGDVWFRFVAPPSGRVFIDTRAGTLTDAAMALYSAATCTGPFTLMECDDDDGQNLMPAIDRMCTPLTPGATYWIRVYGYGGARGTFSICIVAGGGQTSLQSDCNGAFSVCSGTGFTNVAYGNGCGPDMQGINMGCLTGGEHQGSWYAFSVTAAGTLGMTITPSTPADVDWAIWAAPNTGGLNPVDANCLPTAPPIRCSFASRLNTINSGGVNNNPAASTGMGADFFGAAPWFIAGPATDNTDGWVQGIQVPGVGLPRRYLLYVDDHHLAGQPYTVSWNVTPSTMIDCVILPSDVIGLKAVQRTNKVDLTWSTNFEQNSSHFTVERSADGILFEPIGTLTAAGNSDHRSEYLFPDEQPIQGLNYYRVQAVDLDGETRPTNIVTAMYHPDLTTVMVVPNPTRDRAEVILNSAYDGVLHVRILDGSGRLISTFRTDNGVFRFELPIEKLEAGSYTVQLLTAKGEPFARTRFVKQ